MTLDHDARYWVGAAIRQRRAALEITQETLAAAAGLHRTYIGSVERGERNLSIRNLWKIAAALDCPPSVIIREAEENLASLSAESEP